MAWTLDRCIRADTNALTAGVDMHWRLVSNDHDLR
jgi:hypothetical protein